VFVAGTIWRGLVAATLCCGAIPLSAQEFVPLWPAGKKPNFNGYPVTDSVANERIWRVGTPGLYAFTVPRAENKGTTVLICPGGGYERISHIYNGFQFARWFNAHGINAFVLVYRLPNQSDLVNRQLAPLQDAQRAMRILHANAGRWGLAEGKMGVMGISAGGHVATMLGTHVADESAIHDSLDKAVYRPDFMVLLSPVISMGEFAHKGSRRFFLGADTSAATASLYSTNTQVTTTTPPTFLVHARNDSSVNVRNSLLFFSALIERNIAASIHVFPQGGHAIGLVDNPGSTGLWLDLLERWLAETKFTEPIKK
jgi:acetyl esterase/lipase